MVCMLTHSIEYTVIERLLQQYKITKGIMDHAELFQRYDGVYYFKWMIKDWESLNAIREGVLGDEDIVVATYPKSGTAWLLRILTLIRNCGDVARTDAVPLAHAVHVLDIEHIDGVMAKPEDCRIVKTHLTYNHLPRSVREGKTKMIYVTRNPKDLCVSRYFHTKMMPWTDQSETLQAFYETFIKGYVHAGSWQEHVASFWAHRNDGNVLWLTYEDLQQDIKRCIADICNFLGKDLSDDVIDTIANESSFHTMSVKPTLDFAKYHKFKRTTFDESKSKYMRKGVVGDWKNHLTREMSEEIDQMLERDIAPLGLKFRLE